MLERKKWCTGFFISMSQNALNQFLSPTFYLVYIFKIRFLPKFKHQRKNCFICTHYQIIFKTNWASSNRYLFISNLCSFFAINQHNFIIGQWNITSAFWIPCKKQIENVANFKGKVQSCRSQLTWNMIIQHVSCYAMWEKVDSTKWFDEE